MAGILVVLGLLILSGFLTYGIQENRGVLAFLHGTWFREMKVFEEIHEFFGSLLWVLIGLHVSGVVLDRLLHGKEKTLTSMVDGYKVMEGESVRLRWYQSILAWLGIMGSVAVLVYALGVKDNVLTASHNTPVDFQKENGLFVSECGACHTLYPPSLLPVRSWEAVMAHLEEHFGDDASLSPQDNATILSYLKRGADEHATHEASMKILDSMENNVIIAITQTPFWERTHKEIETWVFEGERIKSKANCKACHSDVEKGLLEDVNIKMPTRRTS